jgi:hypothetical protein
MSVLVKGMKMPNGCKECHFRLSTGLGDACALLRKNISATVERGGFHSDCPLIELPPHGRLIDADALLSSDLGGEPFKSVIRRVLMQTPTIIEAEVD